jgi:hypothetical protein
MQGAKPLFLFAKMLKNVLKIHVYIKSKDEIQQYAYNTIIYMNIMSVLLFVYKLFEIRKRFVIKNPFYLNIYP